MERLWLVPLYVNAAVASGLSVEKLPPRSTFWLLSPTLLSQSVKRAVHLQIRHLNSFSQRNAREKKETTKNLTMRVAPCSPTASTTSSCNVDDSSIYARAWRFVQRRLHLRPRAGSCPADMETTKTVEEDQTHTRAINSSYCSEWQRVYMLKELEEAGTRAQWRRQQYQTRQECIKETAEWTPTDVRVQPTFRTQAQRKTAQVTCFNCGLLFFRPLSIASDTSAFCGRDCQTTFEYRRELQDTVNQCESFRSTVNWTRSSEL